MMLTDEEYYLAMREYEQWIDEQEQHQPDMAYARCDQEELGRAALQSPTFMNWLLNNSVGATR